MVDAAQEVELYIGVADGWLRKGLKDTVEFIYLEDELLLRS